MFRIQFDPSIGQFTIQILCWGLWWRTIRTEKAVHVFPTYAGARQWVSSVGLDTLYRDGSANCRRAWMGAEPETIRK